MKKVFLFIFFIVVTVGSVFGAIAEDTVGDSSGYLFDGLSDRPFAFKDNRLERLGGTGVALSTGMSSLYYNPANLADQKQFMINVPQVNLGLYNLAKLFKIEGMKEFLKGILGGQSPETEEIMDMAKKVLMEFGYGIYPFLDVQADVGFRVSGFALDAVLQGQVSLYNMTGRTQDTKFVPSIKAGASIGYGHNFKLGKKASLQAGLSLLLLIDARVSGIGVSDIENMTGGDPLSNLYAGVGLSLPVNVGVSLNYGGFKASLVVRNINFVPEKVYCYGTFKDFLANPFQVFSGNKGVIAQTNVTGLGTRLLSASVDLGFAFNPKWKGLFNPRIEVDLVNITNFTKGEYYDYSNFISHLKVGVELFILKFLKIGAGLNQGRISFGVTLDLWPVVLDVDYAWIDATPVLGQAMSDRFSIVLKLGWDRSK